MLLPDFASSADLNLLADCGLLFDFVLHPDSMPAAGSALAACFLLVIDSPALHADLTPMPGSPALHADLIPMPESPVLLPGLTWLSVSEQLNDSTLLYDSVLLSGLALLPDFGLPADLTLLSDSVLVFGLTLLFDSAALHGFGLADDSGLVFGLILFSGLRLVSDCGPAHGLRLSGAPFPIFGKSQAGGFELTQGSALLRNAPVLYFQKAMHSGRELCCFPDFPVWPASSAVQDAVPAALLPVFSGVCFLISFFLVSFFPFFKPARINRLFIPLGQKSCPAVYHHKNSIHLHNLPGCLSNIFFCLLITEVCLIIPKRNGSNGNSLYIFPVSDK